MRFDIGLSFKVKLRAKTSKIAKTLKFFFPRTISATGE
jgi:hypothetical protein